MDTSSVPSGPPPVSELHQRSDYGLFSAADEPDVARDLLRDLEVESVDGLEGVMDRYRCIVADEVRRERAEAALKGVHDAGVAHDLGRLIEVLYFAGFQGLLQKYSLRFPAYNMLDEFFVSAAAPTGPMIRGERPAATRSWSLLGKRIGFPIGIPASVLTNNHEWVHRFSMLGYNVMTTRTVRSRFHLANQPPPNWVFVPSVRQPFSVGAPPERVEADPSDWVDAGCVQVTTSNSFGVPSYGPGEWGPDLRETSRTLLPEQVLIVSVMGDLYDPTGDTKTDRASLVADFVRTALLAQHYGAENVELNFSCPNSLTPSGQVRDPLCLDEQLTLDIISAVREALAPRTRIVIKLCYLSRDALRSLLRRASGFIDAVAGINTLQLAVQTKAGDPTFPGRDRAGVSGIAVRDYAIDFVRSAALIRIEENMSFEIIGMGGVTDPDSFGTLMAAGASAVQSASGVFANPFLAEDCIATWAATLPSASELQDPELKRAALEAIMRMLDSQSGLNRYDVAARVGMLPTQAFAAIDRLISNNQLTINDRDQLSRTT